MRGLTPDWLKEHAFVGVQPGPGQPDRSHLCAICDKVRYEKFHNGIRIDRMPIATLFADTVTSNYVATGLTFTVTIPNFG